MQKTYFLIIFIAFSACVQPPEGIKPSVLSSEELRVVSSVQRGQQYARSGRMDLAELHFRTALQEPFNFTSVYSDLGYVLLGQNRLYEAEKFFRLVLRETPEDFNAWDNLARVLYKQERLQESIEVYEKFLQQNLDMRLLHPLANRSNIPTKSLLNIFRTLSTTFSVLGYYGEARCYSKLSMDYSMLLEDKVRYARLLLASSQTEEAVSYLRSLVANLGEVPRPKILFDYGMALYAHGELIVAEEAFSRVLTLGDTGETERMIAEIARKAIVLRGSRESEPTSESASEQEEQLSSFVESFLEQYPDVCESDIVDRDRYWPWLFLEDIQKIIKEVCRNEE